MITEFEDNILVNLGLTQVKILMSDGPNQKQYQDGPVLEFRDVTCDKTMKQLLDFSELESLRLCMEGFNAGIISPTITCQRIGERLRFNSENGGGHFRVDFSLALYQEECKELAAAIAVTQQYMGK